MLTAIFPKQAGNDYRGWRLAAWLLALFTLVKFLQGASSAFDTRFVLSTADAIPLEHFNAAGAQTVVSLFALLGLWIMLFSLPTFIVLIRYRALVPLMYLLWLIEEAGKAALLAVNPIERSTALPNGTIVNRALLGVLVVGFVLSLLKRAPKA